MEEVVLIVEDDSMIRNLLSLYISKQSYKVLEAADGEEAMQLFLQHTPNVVILDLMLPKLSGESFCRWVREDLGNEDVSIIMLSAKGQIEDRIAGLSLGADLYLTKPFHPEEVVAYIETSLRRRKSVRKKLVSHDITLWIEEREVYVREKAIYLTRHEFDLLYYLMRHANIVCTREQLVRNLYSYDEQDILDRTIDAHIKKLREKIEDEPSKPKRIQTVRGMGYKFVSA